MDPRIINLLFAVMSYVGSKKSDPNPFVKDFTKTEDPAIYDNMVQALMDCQEFFPEVDAMVDSWMQEDEIAQIDEEIDNYWKD